MSDLCLKFLVETSTKTKLLVLVVKESDVSKDLTVIALNTVYLL